MKKNPLYLKYLSHSHLIIGLFTLFLFYMSTYFGTITLLMPYLNVWESPSRHYVQSTSFSLPSDESVQTLVNQYGFGSKPILITLPSFKDPLMKVSSENQNTLYIHPQTQEIMTISKDEQLLSTFFNELHTGIVIPKIGMPLMGITSIGMLFLSVGGLFLYMYKRKRKASLKHNWRKVWFSWHKILGLSMMPYVIIFALSGAFLGLMLSSSSLFALSTTDFKESNMRKLVAPLIFPKKSVAPSTQNAPSLPLASLHQEARKHYPNLVITQVSLYNYGKHNAQTHFSGYVSDNKAQSGRVNRQSITLESHSGAVVAVKDLSASHGVNKLLSTLYYLHFLPDETLFVRLIFVLLGVGMMVCLMSGYLIWAEKKRSSKGYGADVLNRVSLAFLLGVIPATALILWLHWLIPLETFDKEVWMRGLFYAAWSFWLFYFLFESSLVSALKLLFNLSGWFFIGALCFHGLKAKAFLWQSFEKSDWIVFYSDSVLLMVALLCFYAARKVSNSEFFYRYERKGVFNGY